MLFFFKGIFKNIPKHPETGTRPGKHTKSELENGPVEIDDLPIKNGDCP